MFEQNLRRSLHSIKAYRHWSW